MLMYEDDQHATSWRVDDRDSLEHFPVRGGMEMGMAMAMAEMAMERENPSDEMKREKMK